MVSKFVSEPANVIVPPERILKPRRGWGGLGLEQLWKYRELLYFLAWRDVKVRYKQTVLGIGWAIIQPFMTMVVFSVFFGRLAKVPSDGLPYPIFAFAALVPWTFFSSALNSSAGSLQGSTNLLTKVYFPRLIIPMASILPGVIDFGIAFVILCGMMVYYGVVPTWNVVFLPLLAILALFVALGVGLWASALNVKYRDIRYTIPFATQLWLFATPVAYPSSLLDEPWRTVYALNPMVSVVEGFRGALLNRAMPSLTMFAVSGVIALLMFITGVYYFRRTERYFADII